MGLENAYNKSSEFKEFVAMDMFLKCLKEIK